MTFPHFPPFETEVDYLSMLDRQEAAVIHVREGGPERVYLLEHSPVFTIGRTRDRSSLLDPDRLPFPLVTISRGGQATYHGPGQLIAYPILNLNTRRRDLHLYIRQLEQVIIDLASDFGVNADRRDGLTGVWVGERKLASIGVGVRKWISLHGFGLNVTEESLGGFLAITPCGIDGVSMTSLNSERSGAAISVEDAVAAVPGHFERALEALTV